MLNHRQIGSCNQTSVDQNRVQGDCLNTAAQFFDCYHLQIDSSPEGNRLPKWTGSHITMHLIFPGYTASTEEYTGHSNCNQRYVPLENNGGPWASLSQVVLAWQHAVLGSLNCGGSMDMLLGMSTSKDKTVVYRGREKYSIRTVDVLLLYYSLATNHTATCAASWDRVE